MKNSLIPQFQPYILFGLLFFFSFNLLAQVGINTTTPGDGSLLDVSSADKGIFVPRVNIASLSTIAPVTGILNTPAARLAAAGLLVYNMNVGTGVGFYYWSGTQWVNFTNGRDEWKLTGNAGTTAATNFLGTTDNNALRFRTNNANRFEMTTGGNLRAFANGTAAAPIYSWNANVGTGMFQQTANVIGFSTNTTERFRIPNANQVYAMSNGTEALPFYSWGSTNNTTTGMFLPATGSIGFSTNGIERMRMDANGAIGIGTKIPSFFGTVAINKLNVVGTSTSSAGDFTPMSMFNNTGAGTSLFVYNSGTNTSPALEVGTKNADGIAIRALNTASTGMAIGIYGSTNSFAAGWAGYFPGDVGAVNFLRVSDERWKSNIAPLNAGNDMLKKVMQLSPKSYNWRAAEFPGMGFNPDRTSFGFIAQELKEIFPELVVSKNIPNPKEKVGLLKEVESVSGYYMVDYMGFIPILTEALQEQQKIINSQEERISKLESLVQELLNKQ